MLLKLIKYIFYFSLIILMMVFWPPSAQAAVPVVVFGEYLNYVEQIWAIDDIDIDPDLQSKIIGDLEYTSGLPYDVTVTHTEKIQGTPTDKSDLLDTIIENIVDQMLAIEDEIDELSDDPAAVERLQEGKAELEELRVKAEELKARLVETIALDVHIVKDTTAAIEDFKAIAREQLARNQVGKLSAPFIDRFDQQKVKDFDDYLYQEPLRVASTYLDTNHFDVDDPALPQEELDDIKDAVKESLRSSYSNPIRPEKSEDFVGIDNVFDTDKGGGWDQWLLALQPNNNPYGIYLSAYESGQEALEAEFQKNQTQAIAYQGVKPIFNTVSAEPIQCTEPNEQCPKCEGGVCIGLDNEPKYEIRETGALIAADRAAVTQAQFELAATPEYAPPEIAIGIPSEVLSPPQEDKTAVGSARENVEFWDTVIQDSLNILEDVFCACFPIFCEDWGFGGIGDLFPGFEIPSEITICGRSFDICKYYPEICGPIENLPDEIQNAFCELFPLACTGLTIPGLF